MPTEDDPGTEDATTLARVEATVIGRVQGVGFRYFALRRGADLGLRGWVANEPDGSVRTRAEGTRADLERFLAELADGPPAAIVDRVIAAWSPPVGNLGPFAIRSGSHSGD